MLFDANPDGVIEPGFDFGIDEVTVLLEGINDLGQQVSLSTVTSGGGLYSFTGLRAGNYIISEVQPSIMPGGIDLYADGFDYLGKIEETTDETLWGVPETPDRFAAIQLGTDQHGVNYVFTECKSDNG